MKIELDNTEEKIVRATFDIIQKEGVSKATTKRIAAEAGINEVTVFIELANLPEAEFSIIKVALEDVRAVSDKKLLIAQITDTILDKFEEFFTLQIDEGRIRKVNPRVLGTLCYSITFQSLVLWKIYSENVEKDGIDYSTEFLDILYNGIRVE